MCRAVESELFRPEECVYSRSAPSPAGQQIGDGAVCSGALEFRCSLWA